MEYVRLGRAGVKVSRLALGCMSYGTRDYPAYAWTLDERQAEPYFREALDAGINLFDTADTYSRGASETIVGNILNKLVKRDEVVIATKVFQTVGPGPNDRGLSRKHIMASIDGSLKRLRTDHVDLYQIHRFDADTPIEETMEALHDVVKSGKARYIGASTMYAWQFARMLAASERNGWTRFVSMQPQYNPAYREDERELLPLCAAEGIGVLNWSPLAGGFLVHGRARPEDGITERGKTESPLGTPYDNACDRAIFTAISGIAKARGISNATIVYAWLRARPWITSTLIGATKPGHIAAAVAGLSLELTPGEIEAIETPYRPRAVFGHEVKPH